MFIIRALSGRQVAAFEKEQRSRHWDGLRYEQQKTSKRQARDRQETGKKKTSKQDDKGFSLSSSLPKVVYLRTYSYLYQSAPVREHGRL